MSKRVPPPSVTYTTFDAAHTPSTATGHAGHTLRVDADFGLFCETENKFVPTEAAADHQPGK